MVKRFLSARVRITSFSSFVFRRTSLPLARVSADSGYRWEAVSPNEAVFASSSINRDIRICVKIHVNLWLWDDCLNIGSLFKIE